MLPGFLDMGMLQDDLVNVATSLVTKRDQRTKASMYIPVHPITITRFSVTSAENNKQSVAFRIFF
jgi:hypothetical protein